MQSLYLATIFAASVACLLTSLLIFARRKSGERSRVILACIVMFSVGNYIPRFIALCHGEEPRLVISVPILLLALFMVISYIMYPIEVISPGYLNFRRIVKLYTPWLVLVGIYGLSLLLGTTFPPYHSLLHMFPQITEFNVWFRLLLSVLFFAPVLFIFTTPYTRRYNNTDKAWMLKYTLSFTINIIAYMIVLMADSLIVKISYYYVSVGCSIYIAYMELFERLIEKRSAKIMNVVSIDELDCEEINPQIRQNPLCERILLHMNRTCDYRNPDISLNMLAGSLFTNRTALSNALHELGYSSFSTYINTLRIDEFIRLINNKESANYQDAFYDVGFRSRATAHRNFKRYTGKTPSEYFS
ncbi:helix-turn-helix transcriptional regulator [Bacteroidaceae bacterium HV4-6-C5C]|jgi:Response regulator containing CheY-like receiver domain and AraC-type DNA-binding domain|nr:helix-turn-helix transcriptional regulator [Bacteroidaceae bacterium HV4-6-C5C]